MAILRQLTLGFGAGAFGACILSLVIFVLGRFGLPERFGVAMPPFDLPAFYRVVVWGGIWGFLFVVPVMSRLWWLKGIIIGLIATAAAAFFFSPELGRGPAMLLVYAVVINAIWGVAAGFWFVTTAGNKKNGRKFGSFMR